MANIWEVKMFEVQKFTSLTGHIYDPMPLVANLAWFKKLPKDYQSAIETGAVLAQNYSRYVNMAREASIVAKLTDKGMKVNELTVASKDSMRTKSQAAIVEKVKAKTDKRFVDDWLASIAVMKKDVNAGF